MKQAINGNQNTTSFHPYNGEPLEDGDVLVPMLINRTYADLIDAQGVRTWYKCGIPYLVMFVPVAEEKAEAFHRQRYEKSNRQQHEGYTEES